MLMLPKFHFLWNMEQYLWFLKCESGSGIVSPSLISLLTSTELRLYPVPWLKHRAEPHSVRAGSSQGWWGSPSLCSPGSLLVPLPEKPNPSVPAVLL